MKKNKKNLTKIKMYGINVSKKVYEKDEVKKIFYEKDEVENIGSFIVNVFDKILSKIILLYFEKKAFQFMFNKFIEE